MSRKLQLRFVLVVLLVIGQAAFCHLANAYFEGAFPGRGDYEDWQRANLEYYKGVELQQSGKFDEAIDSLLNATKIYRYDSRYWNSLGFCRQKTKNQLDAELAFRTALSVNPTDKQTWTYLRNLLRLEGRNAEAASADSKLRQIEATPVSADEDGEEWHEKEEKDPDTPLGLFKKFYVGK